MTLSRRLAAEATGTAFLLAAAIGSGIMGERLAAGNIALALLANTLATGAALAALILAFGAVSGAHFNPAVTLAEALARRLPWREATPYIAVQVAGALAGAVAAHLMFGEPALAISQHARSGAALWWSEFVASFGLVAVIAGVGRQRPDAVAYAVGLYIAAAYWFTASTSFANPAATLARAVSDTFAGIRPQDAPAFVLAQLLGAGAAAGFMRWLMPPAARAPAASLPKIRQISAERVSRR